MMPYDRNRPRDELPKDRPEPAPERLIRTKDENLANSLAALFTIFGGHVQDNAPRD
jgi:hypothetical protein